MLLLQDTPGRRTVFMIERATKWKLPSGTPNSRLTCAYGAPLLKYKLYSKIKTLFQQHIPAPRTDNYIGRMVCKRTHILSRRAWECCLASQALKNQTLELLTHHYRQLLLPEATKFRTQLNALPDAKIQQRHRVVGTFSYHFIPNTFHITKSIRTSR